MLQNNLQQQALCFFAVVTLSAVAKLPKTVEINHPAYDIWNNNQ
jgi:hypothetical protein